jgi:hypothetical protein
MNLDLQGDLSGSKRQSGERLLAVALAIHIVKTVLKFRRWSYPRCQRISEDRKSWQILQKVICNWVVVNFVKRLDPSSKLNQSFRAIPLILWHW